MLASVRYSSTVGQRIRGIFGMKINGYEIAAGAKLAGADLPGADLSDARLAYADLTEADNQDLLGQALRLSLFI